MHSSQRQLKTFYAFNSEQQSNNTHQTGQNHRSKNVFTSMVKIWQTHTEIEFLNQVAISMAASTTQHPRKNFNAQLPTSRDVALSYGRQLQVNYYWLQRIGM